MAVQIRQEINILNHVTGSANDDIERVLFDTTQYNGTVTYYFEVVAKIASGSENVTLRRTGTTTDDATIAVTGSTVYALFRSTAFTPPSGATEYMVNCAGGNVQVQSARIIVIQNATTLTNTETQIEIGNFNSARTGEAAAILTNPKYWKYTAANWDGTKTFYAEAVYDSGDMDTITVGIYESAAIDAPSWSLKTTIVSAATTTTPTRTRVAFTPVDGRWYTIFSHNGSMDNHDIYRAGVVVQQGTSLKDSLPGTGFYKDILGGTAGSGETNQAYGNGWNAANTYSLGSVDLPLKKTGSPTDNYYLEVLSTSITGTVLGTSDNVAASGVPTSETWTKFTFATPVSISTSTKYWFRLFRTGARDASNYISWTYTGDTAGSQGHYVRDNTTWGSEQAIDFGFRTYPPADTLTKLEPQYLLANTLFTAGTSLQTSLTKWDSTEWSGVTNTYYFQAEAANGSTSDVTLEQADGGGTVTNSTLTNIDNAQISSALTMPASENLDTKATTNAGDVAAARILVVTVVDQGTVTPQTITGVSRISKNVAQTITGKAAIQKTTTQTITGKSRISTVGTQTETGVSRISKNVAQTVTGVSRVTAITSRTETGVSRISKTVAQTITGKASIVIAVNQTITGTARISKNVAQTITGKAAIQKTATQTITGTSRVSKTVAQTETGTARISKNVSQTETGTARISKTVGQTVTGVAKITVEGTGTQTITGTARISATGTQTITGAARISKSATQTIAGKARIANTNTQTITGKSRISATSTQTETGVARISKNTAQTITGTARIGTAVTDLAQLRSNGTWVPMITKLRTNGSWVQVSRQIRSGGNWLP
jgi:hypothetical protein